MSNKTKKSAGGANGMLNSPATLSEVVQISRATAEDVVSEYHASQGNVHIAMSIQIELLKEIIFSSGMSNEEEFKEKYLQRAKEIETLHREQMQKAAEERAGVTASMVEEAGEIEIKVEE